MRVENITQELQGVLLLDKPINLSSNQALQKIKNLYQMKKIGHTGTLDPLATGMLPLCFGESTKFSSYLLESDKCYTVQGVLGTSTTTDDSEGEILTTKDTSHIEKSDLEEVLENLRGTIEQVPPLYCALKIHGQPYYKYARSGINIRPPPRPINIYHLSLEKFEQNFFNLKVNCSKGTYIRSLVRDIGELLGVGAYVSQLRRLYVQNFQEYPMYTLEDIANRNLEEKIACLLPIDSILKDFPKVRLEDSEILALQQGKKVYDSQKISSKSLVRIYSNTEIFIGLATIFEGYIKGKRLMKLAKS